MPFSDMMNEVSNVAVGMCETIADWQEVAVLINQIKENQTTINNYLKHIHKSHLHTWNDIKKHLPDNITNSLEGGLSDGCFQLNPVDLLLIELYSQEDVDNNGLVYGKDFSISNYDPEKPRCLKDAEQQLETMHIKTFPLESNAKIQFENHLNSMYYEQRQIPKTLEGILIQEIITGEKFINKVDHYVYGYHYIVSDDDPDKPQSITDTENNYLKLKPDNKITWKQLLYRFGYKEDNNINNNIDNKNTECNYVATRLLGEYLHSWDIDGNGLLYGVDFILSNDDSNKPQCLKDIELDVDWSPPENIKIFSWDEFCHTFPDNNPDDRGDMGDD